jgi:DNA repair exonuclease SbcCD ATPase subunit
MHVDRVNRLKFEQAQRIKEVEQAQAKLDYQITVLQNDVLNYTSSINRCNERIQSIDKAITELRDSNSELEDQLMSVDVNIDNCDYYITRYNFWKTAFSPQGIKALLLDRFCNSINSTINNCLSVVSNGKMSMLISPTSTTKGGDERNKLGIEIQNGTRFVKYVSLSGGEKRRVDFALCVSLNAYIAKRFQLPFGLLGIIIMDELFSYLDKEGEELIGQYLLELSMSRTIFVITHTEALSSYADLEWNVRNINGESILEQ